MSQSYDYLETHHSNLPNLADHSNLVNMPIDVHLHFETAFEVKAKLPDFRCLDNWLVDLFCSLAVVIQNLSYCCLGHCDRKMGQLGFNYSLVLAFRVKCHFN